MFPRLSLVPAVFVVLGWALVSVRPAGSHQSDPGQVAYDRACKVCHGPDGIGNAGPALVPFEMDEDALLLKVREGGGEMPAFSAARLSDEEVKQIAVYLKSLKAPARPAFASVMRAHQPDLRHD